MYHRIKQICALHSQHLSFCLQIITMYGLRARMFLSRTILSATFERSPVKKGRDNVIGNYQSVQPLSWRDFDLDFAGLSLGQERGCAGWKDHIVRGLGRKLQTRVCLCVAIKKLSTSLYRIRAISYAFISVEKAVGFFPRMNIKPIALFLSYMFLNEVNVVFFHKLRVIPQSLK